MSKTFHKPIHRRPAAKERRTHDDVVYASIAEMKRAAELDLLLKNGDIRAWFRQVPIQLGADMSWRADFVIFDWTVSGGRVWAEDVKGFKTPASVRIEKLWRKYGKYPLHIVGLSTGAEVIPGGRAS